MSVPLAEVAPFGKMLLTTSVNPLWPTKNESLRLPLYGCENAAVEISKKKSIFFIVS
jgi:hypothetical protein